MLCGIGSITRSFVRNKKGSTAVEFSLVAIPFIFLLIGIVETSLMFAGSSILQGATQQAARMIRTGQVQQSGEDPEEMFREVLCEHADTLLDCTRIQYEVITMEGGFTDFSEFPPEFNEDGDLEGRGFTPGGVNDVVLIRAIYRYPLMTPIMGNLMADGPDNTKLMISTVVMENEPYDVNNEEVASEM